MKRERTQRYAVVYDITDDRERHKIDKALKGWGQRIQKSVFSVTTTRSGAARLQAELAALGIDGSVLMLRLQTQVDIIAIGREFHDPEDDIAFIF